MTRSPCVYLSFTSGYHGRSQDSDGVGGSDVKLAGVLQVIALTVLVLALMGRLGT
jgi:hypothetical protein